MGPHSAADCDSFDRRPSVPYRRFSLPAIRFAMPPAMCAQAAMRKRRLKKAKDEKRARERAFELGKTDLSVRQIAGRCELSVGIAQRIRKAVKNNDDETLKKLLDPVNHHPGRRPVLEPAEEELLVDKAYEAARRGVVIPPCRAPLTGFPGVAIPVSSGHL